MTDRLVQLLREEAADVRVPAPPTAAILLRGKRERRRLRSWLAALGGGTAALTAGAVVGLGGIAGQPATAPDETAATAAHPFYAVGDEIYFPLADTSVSIDDKAVKSMYATSAGVVVRHGDNAYSDGGGAQRFSRIDPDGSVEPLTLVSEETVHASDPSQPFVAYAENAGGRLDLVVYDVAADSVETRIDLGATRQTWFPVALDGDRAYVQDGYDGTVREVTWRDGESRDREGLDVWSIHGGRTVELRGKRSVVTDVTTGAVLWSAEVDGALELSPDGRYVVIRVLDVGGPGEELPTETQVYEVDSGAMVTLPGESYRWGWTAVGELFSVSEDGEMRTCSPASGSCTTVDVEVPPAPPEECFTETMGTGRNEVIESWCEGGSVDVILGGEVRES